MKKYYYYTVSWYSQRSLS